MAAGIDWKAFSVFTGSRHHSRMATNQQQPTIEDDGHQDALDNSKPFYCIEIHFDGEWHLRCQ